MGNSHGSLWRWVRPEGILSWVLLASALIEATEKKASEETSPGTYTERPIMYTYFEPITPPEEDFTDMTRQDHEELLQYWRQAWTQAGWQPVVLTEADSQSLETVKVTNSSSLSAWARLTLHRWMAMSVALSRHGPDHQGWMVDYDAFPLKDFGSEVPHDGQLTLHQVVAPTLVSGSATAFADMAWQLGQHAREMQQSSNDSPRRVLWTDTLGLLHVRHTHPTGSLRSFHEERHVLEADRVLGWSPTTAQDCSEAEVSRRIQPSHWVIHFSPLALQRAHALGPRPGRRPKDRLRRAQEWLSAWHQVCRSTQTEKKSQI